MKTPKKFQLGSAGNALVMTMIMTAVALALLAGIMSWSAGNARLASRSNEYTRAVAAAEAATEKVNSRMASDYLSAGEVQVVANLNSYRAMVPTGSDSSYWTNWEFNDTQGNVGSTFVQQGAVSNYAVLTGAYAGLTGFASTYTVVSDARELDTMQNVVAGVLEAIQLTRIPIFQFAMYSSGEMEVSCGNPFKVTGPVHSNGQLYVEPDNSLTFQSGVTAVGNVVFGRDPLDPRGNPSGAVTYVVQPKSGQPALTLPIGVTNTPQAVREIIEPPQPFELASSPIGRERYYNQCDLVITVMNTNILVTSGYFNGFGTVVTNTQVALFVSTNNSFTDSREHKTVLPVDINVGTFVTWCTSTNVTNINLRSALGRNICSIYVWDQRTLPSTSLGAVRVSNGAQLPPQGLTVATGDPLYVLGHYNQPVLTNRGTANVSTTLPASLVADAVTILSANWLDGNSGNPETTRGAGATTVNAAILAGEVDTTAASYSGGMENFPRFLENWGSGNVFTYNGSMIKMFPSLYATNVWSQASTYYTPPSRNWTYDANFNNPSLLPPLTPSLQVVSRSQWATLAPNQTTAP